MGKDYFIWVEGQSVDLGFLYNTMTLLLPLYHYRDMLRQIESFLELYIESCSIGSAEN